ncbi:transcriptional regulator [Psychrobacillus sp.]|uniref:transcriptional regulator n=1 Tax=Psychrobacillus TaxID=1221880 RepID=UPI0028BE6057|nr:transcriptional regulator [Psychrobacillus sp.]
MRINILKSMQLNQIIEMIYMKNNGEISKRKVKVLCVEGNTLKAHCFLRNNKRTFKIENVLACVPIIHKERGVV